jgi:hypothetical protein
MPFINPENRNTMPNKTLDTKPIILKEGACSCFTESVVVINIDFFFAKLA